MLLVRLQWSWAALQETPMHVVEAVIRVLEQDAERQRTAHEGAGSEPRMELG